MRAVYTFILLSILLIPAAVAAQVHENMLQVTHHSEAMDRSQTFHAYVPEALAEGERFPVLFVLHGAQGSHMDWPTKSRAGDLAKNYRMILIFPDGGEYGWYVDSPIERHSQYESYIVRELIPLVDRTFPTAGTREGRAIMGLSMGGHGALNFAAKHPELFASASSMSGILHLTNHPDKWEIDSRLGPIESSRDLWEENSSWHLAPRFARTNVRLLLDCGIDDTGSGAIEDTRQMHKRLVELGVPHVYREFPGAHSWQYWDARLHEHWNFHQAAMAETLQEGNRWYLHYFQRLKVFFAENAQETLTDRDEPTIALVGSSGMEGFASELLPGWRIYNRGIASDTLGIGTRGLSHRIEESVFDMKPDVIAFQMGTNDLGDRARVGEPSMEQVAEHYEYVVQTMRERLPDTPLLLISPPPVRGRFAHLSEAIVEHNATIARVAQLHGAIYVDLHSRLVDEEGLLKEEYTRDGLHLTREANEILARMILEELSALRP